MKYNSFLAIIFAAIFSLSASPALASLGISPSDWTEPNGMLGQTIEKTFTLSRDDAFADLGFTSQISGELSNWITIKNGNSFAIPKGTQQFPVDVILSIPQNAGKKEYKGEIRLNSTPASGQSGQIGILLSALIRIDLTVTDKPFLSYSVQQIEIPEQESGNFVNIILKIANDGNILAKPTKVTADIFDKFNSTKISSFVLTDFSSVAGVPSFSHGNINLKIPIHLSPEQYWANVSVYQDSNILKTDDLTFDIAKAGSLKPAAPAVNKNYLLITGIILLVIIVITAGVIVVWTLIKKKQETHEL